MSVETDDDSVLMNGPIPGSSLTQELGSQINERPPMYSDPAEAYEYIVSGLTGEKAIERISVSAQLGIPAELIARSIVFAGWAQGYYSIDTMLLIFGNVFEVLLALLDKSGIEYQKLAPRKEDDRLEDAFKELERREKEMEEDDSEEEETSVEEDEEEIPVEEEEVPTSGLMGRKE
tara:strand:- start:1732 stop:2259 length:528 start_codon:yes stop_codon:yes gene_type:complete